MADGGQRVDGSGYVIVPASWRDLSALRQVEQICFRQDAWPLWDLIGVLTLPNVVRLKAVVGVQAVGAQARGAQAVGAQAVGAQARGAQAGERMVGFIAGDVRRAEKLAWVATLGVLPEYRRQGMGAALLQACEGQLAMPRIRLCVRASNEAAIRLYERAGYHRFGHWEGYYADGEEALVLEKVRGRS